MRRTTVFLPDHLHEQLRQDAFQARVSMAELIRTRLEIRSGKKRARRLEDPLAAVEGIVRDGTLSRDIDEALYQD